MNIRTKEAEHQKQYYMKQIQNYFQKEISNTN